MASSPVPILTSQQISDNHRPPLLTLSQIRLSLYSLSIAVAVMRHRLPNKRSFNTMNVSLAVAGLILLGSGLRQAFHNTLRLSDAVGLTLLLAVVRPSWRGPWGRKFWLSSLRFPKTPESSSTRVRSGFFDAGIFCGMVPWLNYILVDTVFGHPDTFGPDPTCNRRVRLSLFGAHTPVAVPATPYAVSILLLGVMLAMLAIEARQCGLADEVPLAKVLEELNVRQELLDKADPDSPPWNDTRIRNRVLGSYNKSLQNSWIDVTLYRCIASVLGRVSLIATLEHTLVLNKSEGEKEPHHGLHLLQLVVVLSAACILFRGLAYRWLREEDGNAESEDDDDGDHVDLVLWFFLTAHQPGTWRATLADSMSFDTQIISTYFNMRGASSANAIAANFGNKVRKLLGLRETLSRETQRLAREARDVVSREDECMLPPSICTMASKLNAFSASGAVGLLNCDRRVSEPTRCPHGRDNAHRESKLAATGSRAHASGSVGWGHQSGPGQHDQPAMQGEFVKFCVNRALLYVQRRCDPCRCCRVGPANPWQWYVFFHSLP